MPPVGFEPMISAGERPKTNALDRTATGTGGGILVLFIYIKRLASNEIFSPSNKIHGEVEVGRAKDLSAALYISWLTNSIMQPSDLVMNNSCEHFRFRQ
jgi:hypothetical protein